MNNKLTCSVAMTTYKGAKYVVEQLRSIEEQTVLPDEIIICDDVSPDNTIKVIRDYIATSRLNIQLFQNEQNLGYWKNFEKAISLCTEDIVFLCDQDDVWSNNKVELFLQEFKTNNNLVYAFSDANVVDSDLNITHESLWAHGWRTGTVAWASLNNQDFFDTVSTGYYPLGCLVAAKRLFLHKIIPFLTHHDRWIAYCAAGFGDIKAIKESCISYRRHSSNTTPTIANDNEETNGLKAFFKKATGALREITQNDYEKQFVYPQSEHMVIKNALQLFDENGSKIDTNKMKQLCDYLFAIAGAKNKNFISRIFTLRKLKNNGMYKMFRSYSKKAYFCDCIFMFVNSFKSKAKR